MYLCIVLYTGPVLQNLNFITFLSQIFTGIFRSYSFFMAANVRKGVAEGHADCVPIFLSQIPLLFHNKIFNPTISLIQVGLVFHFIIVTVLLHYSTRVNICLCKSSRGSISHLVEKLSYELNYYEIGSQFPTGARDISFLQGI
jgi:hypothetical protein